MPAILPAESSGRWLSIPTRLAGLNSFLRERIIANALIELKGWVLGNDETLISTRLDWHRDFTFGDDSLTLVEGYHIDPEAEANCAAGILLFIQEIFTQHVKGVQRTLKSLNKVADGFGNSWTSTLYRTIEILDVPSFSRENLY